MNTIRTAVPILVGLIPVVVYLVGLVFALVTRSRRPRRSTLGLIAFTVLLVGAILGEFWFVLARQLIINGSLSVDSYASTNVAVTAFQYVLMVVAFVFVMVGLYGRDKDAEQAAATATSPAASTAPTSGTPGTAAEPVAHRDPEVTERLTAPDPYGPTRGAPYPQGGGSLPYGHHEPPAP